MMLKGKLHSEIACALSTSGNSHMDISELTTNTHLPESTKMSYSVYRGQQQIGKLSKFWKRPTGKGRSSMFELKNLVPFLTFSHRGRQLCPTGGN